MSRRAQTGDRRRGGFRFSGLLEETAIGVSFVAGDYARGVAGEFANVYRRQRTIWAPDARPGAGFSVVAGLDNGGGGSFVLASQALGGQPVGNLLGFDGIYSVPAGSVQHQLLTGELGRYVVDDNWTDGTFQYHARNGRLLNRSVADADVSWSSANPFAMNCRSTGIPPTLQFGSLTLFDVQLSTVVPTLAQVLADAQLPPGVAVAGSLNHWFGPEAGAATWVDRVSGRVVTFGGAPVRGVVRPVYRRSLGQFSLFTDSNGVREPVGLTGNAWRKYNLENVVAAGVAITANGKFAPGAAATTDFDNRNTATGGQALGVANGAVASCLSTLAADLAAVLPGGVPPDGCVAVGYGVNDSFVYCVTMGLSASDGRDAFLVALDTAITTIGGHQSAGRPIVVITPLRLATGVSTATQRSFLDLVYADLPAFIAARVGTYPGLRLADTRAAVTPTQADADNVAVLYDGTHMTLAMMPVYAAPVSAALLSAA